MNAKSTKASIAAEVMRIAEEREQFIRQCIELYSSTRQKVESEQVIRGRTTFPDETTHEPHAAKPDEHVSKALGATAEIETAPRSLVTSASDDVRGAMARDEESPEPLWFAHQAAEPKNGRVVGRLLFGLLTMMCLIAPMDTSGIAVLPVSGQSADYPTSAPSAAAPSAADAQAIIETEPAAASTPAPMHRGTVSDAIVAAPPELMAGLFEEFRQRYLPQAGGAVAHAPVKITATPRSAPKPPVARRVSVAAKPPAQRSRSIAAVAAGVNPSYVPADRAGGQEQPAAVLPRYLPPYPPAPSPFGFPVGEPIYAPRPAGPWVPRAVIGYPTPLQNTGTQSYDTPVQRVPLAGSYISRY